MYLEVCLEELEQKELYFKLNDIFCLEKEGKVAGIYAIFKEDICLYVGQSQNVASRIATHLKGKYETASDIYIWDIKDCGFDSFFEKSKESQKAILINAENWMFKQLKPIENLAIDFNIIIPKKQQPDIDLEYIPSISIILKEPYETVIYTELPEENIINIDYLHCVEILDDETHNKVLDIIKVKNFCSKGYKNEY